MRAARYLGAALRGLASRTRRPARREVRGFRLTEQIVLAGVNATHRLVNCRGLSGPSKADLHRREVRGDQRTETIVHACVNVTHRLVNRRRPRPEGHQAPGRGTLRRRPARERGQREPTYRNNRACGCRCDSPASELTKAQAGGAPGTQARHPPPSRAVSDLRRPQ